MSFFFQRSRRRLRGCVFASGLALGAGPFLQADAPPPADDAPWQAALAFDTPVAVKGFAERHRLRPDDARTTIAYASALLVQQPRTEHTIGAARDLLATVAGSPAAGDERILATYLLARVEQDHLSPPRIDSARARYESLVRDHPGHPLADQAAVQLALLIAWGEPRRPAAEAMAGIETLLAAMRSPAAMREARFILGRLAWEDREDAATALVHFQAGRALGYEKPFRNAEVDLTIAALARRQGDLPLALVHYRAFLAASKRDLRASTVRRSVAEIEATLASARTAALPDAAPRP